MIIARFFYAGDLCTGCSVGGHAEYAEPGEDVVCAYASSAVQTVANLMMECFHLPAAVEEDESSATVVIRLTAPDDSGNAQRLLQGLQMQLEALEQTFPANIQLKHMEV